MQNYTLCLTCDIVTIVWVLNETIQITEVTKKYMSPCLNFSF